MKAKYVIFLNKGKLLFSLDSNYFVAKLKGFFKVHICLYKYLVDYYSNI